MKSSTSSTILQLCALVAAARAGIGPVAELHIVNKVIAPDGFNRSAILAGGSASSASMPGPVITATKGGRLQLNVIDELTDTTMMRSTSIHWHGLFQAGSSWADGAASITQCPIAPGHSFLYDFGVPNQAGTFWYHSHYSTQYCDGLRGPIVIYDPNDPHRSLYDVDNDDTVITLADWYHAPARCQTSVPVIEDATLINGLGRYPKGPTSPLAVISVEVGKRYRFRLISMSCDPNFTFSIDGHVMTIIEVDGINAVPLEVDSIQIFTGQRYSFVLNANQSPSNYWVRALPNLGPSGFTNGINSAILRYQGAPEADPTSTQTPSTNPMLETNLHPLESLGAPGIPVIGQADVNLNLAIAFGSGKFSINGATFTPPSVPVLLQILSGAKTAHELLPSGIVYTLPPDKVVELSIPGGTDGSPHPFHLHGHAFDVIRSAGNSIPNFVNPVRRDVVNLGGSVNDNVTIRFVTDNAGPWIFHCHIDWHLERGLAIVFVEDPDTIAQQHPPASWDDLCPTFNVWKARLTSLGKRLTSLGTPIQTVMAVPCR